MSHPDFLPIVIGTAGHIDHGKSALVEQLTGHHPDTLEEEKARGLTINLGYATLRMHDGREVGIIDVPGHERFIKNMVAGATGIQFVLFVIAADDGVMPQSREHLDILQILGVKRGLIVLTKIDIVDGETREIACEEIREFVAGSFLEGAPILPVSSVTGEGYDALRAGIEASLGEVRSTFRDLPFRMPVQRVFSAAGHGTVATGVPLAGRLRVGDTIEILPYGTTSRIRGLQAYGHRIDEATAGHRAALNLADVDYHSISRGILVAMPGMYRATTNVEARLEYPASNDRPLRHLSPIRFHAGTVETVGRVSLLDRNRLSPGESTFVQLFLQDPVAVAEGDRYILRSISPMHTIGGGVVIGTARRRHRRARAFTTEHLARKECAIDTGTREYLAEVLWGDAREPRPLAEVSRDVHCKPAELTTLLAQLEAQGEILALGGGRAFLHREILAQIEHELVGCVEALHERSSRSLFVPLRDVNQRMKLDHKVLEEVVSVLAERGTVRRGADGRIGLAGFFPDLTPKQREMKDRIEAFFRDQALSPPRREEVADACKAGKDEAIRLVDLLIDEGVFVRLRDDRIFHREVIDTARETLTRALRERERLTAAEIKEWLDTSRKNLIPLLEHFDQEGTTVRDGDYRFLPEQGVGSADALR